MSNFFVEQKNMARKAKEAFIRHAIDEIVERKKRENILPARAKWRELCDVLKEEHWPILDAMVKRGIIHRQETINYPTFVVDWEAYNKEEAYEKQMKKLLK